MSSTAADAGGEEPPTIASFSHSPARRSTLQVHQKSPLLVATPPQVTRALSRAFPWILAADYVFGLLTWTSGDPWESFLLVGSFWFVALYGGAVLRWAGPLALVALLILAMFLRHRRETETTTTLDAILASLNSLNNRVEIFFAPCTVVLNTLSSEKTATTATTRPKLTRLFVRILLLNPLWIGLSVYPFEIVTPRRIVVAVGTAVLSWHSRPAKVARTILWRSSTLRAAVQNATGLQLTPLAPPPPLPPRNTPAAGDKVTPLADVKSSSPGVKFTFALYENQRRWLGVGWTATMFAYERAPWTDEHLQPAPSPEEFQLPEPPAGGKVRWRWVKGEDWEVEGAERREGKKKLGQEVKDRLGGPGGDGEGWWYYDNKWRDGRRGVDGWGKYTRRRKWVRRAELVEADEEDVSEKKEKEIVKTVPPSLPPRAEVLEEDVRDSGSEDEVPHVRVVDVDGNANETVLEQDDEHQSWH
jgi:hypothetical protein